MKIIILGLPRAGSTLIWQIINHFSDRVEAINIVRGHGGLLDENGDFVGDFTHYILPYRDVRDVICSLANSEKLNNGTKKLGLDGRVDLVLNDVNFNYYIDSMVKTFKHVKGIENLGVEVGADRVSLIKYEDYLPDNIGELVDYLHEKLYGREVNDGVKQEVLDKFSLKQNKVISDRLGDFSNVDFKSSKIHGNHITTNGYGGEYNKLSEEFRDKINDRIENYLIDLGYE